eukprot:2420488-Amphidinium_carterae.4
MQLTTHVCLPCHQDRNNVGNSCIIGLGQYSVADCGVQCGENHPLTNTLHPWSTTGVDPANAQPCTVIPEAQRKPGGTLDGAMLCPCVIDMRRGDLPMAHRSQVG